jgi:DNA repair and recombination protein RAD52
MDPNHSFGKSTYSAKQSSEIKSNLSKQLGPEYIAKRQGPGGSKLTYLEGWKAINIANEIFEFNGWSHQIIDQSVDYVLPFNADGREGWQSESRHLLHCKSHTQRWGIFELLKAYHEDVGYGSIENARSKKDAFEKAKKEASTDALVVWPYTETSTQVFWKRRWQLHL